MKNRPRAALSALVLALTAALTPAAATAAPDGPHRAAQAEPRPAPCTGAYRNDARLGPKNLPRSWEAPVRMAQTAGASDHPFLVGYGKDAYLSWNTEREGYRLVPLKGAAE